MTSDAKTVDEYLDSLPEDRQEAMKRLRKIIVENIPQGFQEEMSYGMIGYVVPHSIYPDGYHCTPELPLPFLNIASQKNFIALYHMTLYSNEKLYKWFTEEYAKACKTKLDMGKSCVRFKKIDQIPYDLIKELAQKVTVEDWISTYEKNLKK